MFKRYCNAEILNPMVCNPFLFQVNILESLTDTILVSPLLLICLHMALPSCSTFLPTDPLTFSIGREILKSAAIELSILVQ